MLLNQYFIKSCKRTVPFLNIGRITTTASPTINNSNNNNNYILRNNNSNNNNNNNNHFSTRTFVAAATANSNIKHGKVGPHQTILKYDGVRLNTLQDNPGAKKQKKRKGRGPGSGLGKTAGRGHKGQKARANGGIRIGFEGGQTPLYRRLPKRGFRNKFAKKPEQLNLDKLEKFIEAGRLNPKETITMKHLYDSGIVGKIKFGVKLLGQGSKSFSTPINIEVSGASNSAIDAIEKCGGTITSVYYNRLGLRVLLKPEKFEGLGPLPRRARPPPKLMKYYTSDEKRGEFSVFVRNRDSNNNTVVGEGEREGEGNKMSAVDDD